MLTDFGSFILRENRFKLRVQRMHLRIHGPPLSMKAVKDRKAGGEVIGRLVILVSCSANLKKLEMRNGNVARRLRRVRIGLGELLAGGQRILSGPQGGFSSKFLDRTASFFLRPWSGGRARCRCMSGLV